MASESTPFKMIRTTNVRNGFIDTENVRYVDEATFRRWTRRAVPLPGDVVLTREAPLGEVGIIRNLEPVFLGQRTIMYRADPRQLDPYFLMYSMLSDPVQGQIRSYGSGSTVEHMRLPDCFNLQIPLPPLETQRQIAAILSAYDDLIENNNQRIKLLEEMAHRLYREWFVDFRYQGYEAVPLADSEIGLIPMGWDIVALGQVSKIYGGSTITKASYVTNGFTAYSAAGPDGRLVNYQVEGAGIVLSAVGARCGRTWFADGKWSAIANTLRIHPDLPTSTAEWLYFATFGPHEWPKRGSAQPFIAINDARARRIVLPPSGLIHEFTARARPLLQLVKTLQVAITNRRATRDLLLPRLISGEIDVTNLDIAMPDLAA